MTPLFDNEWLQEEDLATAARFDNPTEGDVFHEMASYWMFVIGVHPDGRVAVVEAHGGATLPRDGKLIVFDSGDAYRSHYGYKSPGMERKYPMRPLPVEKRQDVTGWLSDRGGWPEPDRSPRDGRATRQALTINVPIDPIAQCPAVEPDYCDTASIWLIAQRWHTAAACDCPF